MTAQGISATQFVQRWAGRSLTESAAAQSHFNDLCDLLSVPKPTDNRETDSTYGFEARTDISASGVYATRSESDGTLFYQVTTGSGPGFADVWKRDCFCWEYKGAGKHRTLNDALAQLRIYSASLGNPPLLVVCDIDRYEIHTNFNGYPTTKIAFTNADLANPSDQWKKDNPTISPLEVLRKVFDDQTAQWFKPKKTREAITAEFAKDMGDLAIALREAGNDPHAVAHLIMQIVFCFFAEDIGLLPRGLFGDLIQKSIDHPAQFPQKARALFKAMELGGHFGAETIAWFNGGLFKDVDKDPVITIAPAWLGKLLIVARKDWDSVDPSIFGTLFERSLDPGKRSQIGAHYTSREDIMLIVDPVVMQPLTREWLQVQKDVAEWIEQRTEARQDKAKQRRLNKKIEDRITAFVDHLGSITILDPACGSGNFLYVTIQQLLDLENEVRGFAARKEISVTFTPRVQPRQLMGIDVNDYACELARVSIWIGYLQWLHANGSSKRTPPILDPLDTIENRDAILKWADGNGRVSPVWQPGAKCLGLAEWPKADFIIGNPPFLGGQLLISGQKPSKTNPGAPGLGEPYTSDLRRTFDDLPQTSDLCCYWFKMALPLVKHTQENGRPRVGLLATQGIRGVGNRKVLDLLCADARIFNAWSDRDWVVEGVDVHVSIICFDDGTETMCNLDNQSVAEINADLSTGLNILKASRLLETRNLSFQGPVKVGKFEIEWPTAASMLAQPNPNGTSNLIVLFPYVTGGEVAGRSTGEWIIDFRDMNEATASLYEAPFEYVTRLVKPTRTRNRDPRRKRLWWLHGAGGTEMKRAIRSLTRFIVCSRHAKDWVFRFVPAETFPDSGAVVFAFDTDYALGLLQSAIHELWARKHPSQVREKESGFRYTSTACFETFPLPWAPGKEPTTVAHYKAIAAAAKELNELRENWLNPPEWINAIADAVDRFEDFKGVPKEALPLLRQSAIAARAAKDARLKKRTLTNLYNERPGWLKIAHHKLDKAVLAAYKAIDPNAPNVWDPAWADTYGPFGAGEITIIKKGKRPDSPEVIVAKEAAIAQRKIIDEQILANLLRLNQQRAAALAPSAKRTTKTG